VVGPEPHDRDLTVSDAGGSGRHSMARSVIDASGQPAEVSCTTVALLLGVLSLTAGSAVPTDA